MEEADLNIYRCLNRHKVRYVLIGGIAAILYGSVRVTRDTDILIEPTFKNADRLLKALQAAYFGTATLTTPEKILKNEVNVFQDYVHLDVFTRIKGLSFKKVWANRLIKHIKGVRIPLISLADLILSKEAAAREIDLIDIGILRKVIAINKAIAKRRKQRR